MLLRAGSVSAIIPADAQVAGDTPGDRPPLRPAETQHARARRDFPLMKRINETINLLARVLLAVYFGAFLYWIWTEFIR